MIGWTVVGPLALLLGLASASSAQAQPLTTFQHHVVGARVRALPEELFVPKNIPGSLAVGFMDAEGAPHPDAVKLGKGLHVEAVLRGPAFPAYRLLGLPGEPLMLPPIALAGEYQIDDIRVVDTESGDTRAMAIPSRVAVHVFPEVLVSQVVSRPLTIDEIAQRGIIIDSDSFSALEFQATFVLGGRSFPVRLPVVTPKFKESVELISSIERHALVVEAQQINALLAETIALPQEMLLPGLNLQIKGVNFERVEDGEGEGELRSAAMIPGLVVIPGSVGFLNQFFSVQIFTANAAPARSAISVHSLQAELVLPPGRDHIAGNDDDPIRFARVGADAEVHPILPIHGLGVDGRAGTNDDTVRLQPGQTGQAEFLVEGLREGLHVFDIKLRGTLDGFAQREVHIEGVAAGSVLVRNPKFSIVFSHPRAVRAGEPYTAQVTVMNTSETPAYRVSTNLNRASLVGTEFAPNQIEQVPLGDLAPGTSSTAVYRLVARTTGQVRFAKLTSDDGLSGRFDLTMAVDERGVELSSDVIGYPEWVALLPESIRRAADHVLGQALSSATAAMLPPGVRKVDLDTVRQRVIELAEAGQRISHGDSAERTYLDLLLDWHGGRTRSLAFDQIMRETAAGAGLRKALLDELATQTDATGLTWIRERASDIAGRSESWGFAAASAAGVGVTVSTDGGDMSATRVSLSESGYYRGVGGASILIRDPDTRPETEVVFRVPALAPSETVGWIAIGPEGHGVRTEWTVTSQSGADVCYRYFPMRSPDVVTIDVGCVQGSSSQLSVGHTTFEELAPAIVAVDQDLSILVERPRLYCFGPSFDYFGLPRTYENYGTLALVLFSKPMPPDLLERAGAIALDSGAATTGVKLQQGGRVALANFRKGFGTLRARSIHLAPFVTDQRGHAFAATSHVIDTIADDGVAVDGRVYGMTGEPLAGIPVTLTMHDSTTLCAGVNVRSSEVLTDSDGRFTFDFVMSDVPFSISATDIRGLSATAAALLREAAPSGEFDADEIARLAKEDGTSEIWAEEFNGADGIGAVVLAQSVDRAEVTDFIASDSPRLGSTVPVALRFRGRGTVAGTVFASDGVTPVADAAVNLYPDLGSRELGRGMFSTAAGGFQFAGVPLGELSVRVETADGRSRVVAFRLDQVGQRLDLAIVLSAETELHSSLEGTVYESNGITPHAQAEVVLTSFAREVVARTRSDAMGQFAFASTPVGDHLVFAISSDGRRSVQRIVQLQPQATAFAHLVLPGFGVVSGRVVRANGSPAPGALVAGGQAIVTTDAEGAFTLTGVPSGLGRAIFAGLPVSATNDSVRLGEGAVDVLPGLTSYIVVRLNASGRISGRVTDVTAAAVSRVRVAIPVIGGFLWTDADTNGNYSFAPMSLGAYLVTAPAPQVRGDNTDALVAAAQSAIESHSQADLEAAMNALLPRLSSIRPGTPERSPPPSFGGTTAELIADGQTVTANISYLPEGEISGRVLNHLGVPIAAAVRLSATGLNKFGGFSVLPVGGTTSDPVTGEFSFTGIEVGPYTLVASSTYYPQQVSITGITTIATRDALDRELRFASPGAAGAHLVGRVMKDGVPAGAGVRVQIDDPSFEILTIADGTFDPQLPLDAGRHLLTAIDPVSGRSGFQEIGLTDGQIGQAEIVLLSTAGGLDVTVVDAVSQPAAGASIGVRRFGAPSSNSTLTTNGLGVASASNLVQGRYGISACRTTGQTRLCASGVANVPGVGRATLTLRLAPSGTIRGRYVESDGATPVTLAQVSISLVPGTPVAIAITDTLGEFEVEGIPLGQLELVARNAVTGRAARTVVQMVSVGQVANVVLREDALGEVVGGVVSVGGVGYEPGVIVTLEPESPLFPLRSVTTDPAGQFSFPGVPPGAFSLTANAVVAAHHGSANGVMPTSPIEVRVDVPLERRGAIYVYVKGPTHAAEAGHIRMNSSERVADTNSSGRAAFVDLPMKLYHVEVSSLAANQSRSVGTSSVEIDLVHPTATVTVDLSGVGSIEGVVRSSVSAPVSDAEVRLEHQGHSETIFVSGADGTAGHFLFTNVEIGTLRVTARKGALAGSATATVAHAGSNPTVEITLTHAADVFARLLRADGTTIVPNTDVVISYKAPSGLLGADRTRTSSLARFRFNAVPGGCAAGSCPFVLSARKVLPGGAVGYLYREAQVGTSTTVNLGDLKLDEEAPTVVESLPADGATQVAVNAHIKVSFSEDMNPMFDDEAAAYVVDDAGARVEATMDWETVGGTYRRLVISPNEDLHSETRYSVVILGPPQLSLGGFAGPGPTDTADRPLDAPFVARFTTIDSIPPTIETFTPADRAEQVDPSAVVRLTFNEPLDRSSVDIEIYDVTTSAVVVPSAIAFGFDDHLVVVTPAAFLSANRRYEARVIGVTDRAGNSVVGLPVVHHFGTVDTVGPTITDLTAVGAGVVAGASLGFRATLATTEPGIQIQATQDLLSYALSPPGSDVVTLVMGAPGTTHVQARGIDRFGNFGPFYSEDFTITSNQPPAVALSQEVPASGPLLTGQAYTLRITATDDSRVVRTFGNISGAFTQARDVLGAATVNFQGTIPSTIGPGATVTFHGTAEDNSGAVTTATDVVFTLADGAKPDLSLTGPTGQPEPGETISLRLVADDAFGVAETTIEVTGAATLSDGASHSGVPNHTDETFEVTVPADAGTYAQIHVTATASDENGNVQTRYLTLIVADVVAPTVVSISPENRTTGVSLTTAVVVTFSEPVVGVDETSLVLSANGLPVAAIVTPSPDGTSATLSPTTPLSPLTRYDLAVGDSIVDEADLNLVAEQTEFTTENLDLVSPRLLSIRPADTSTGAPVPLAIVLEFDEPIARSSITAGDLVLMAATGGDALATELSFEKDDRVLRFVPRYPGVTLRRDYIATITGEPADAAGNVARDLDDLAWSEVISAFRTGGASIVAAVGGFSADHRVVEGHVATAQLVSDEHIVLAGATWEVDGAPVSGTQGTAPTIELSPPMLVDGLRVEMVVSANSIVADSGIHAIADETLTVEPRGTDYDGDGMTNGDEASAGLNPWVDDADADPDDDGVVNSDELVDGTDPHNSDTDGDGILDGADLDPLSGNRTPGLGLASPGETKISLRLDSGSSSFVLPSSVGSSTVVTVEMWVHSNTSTNTALQLIGSSASPRAINVGRDATGHFTVSIKRTGTSVVNYASPNVITSDAWHHVAATYDGSHVRLFVDGQREVDQDLVGTLDWSAGTLLVAPGEDVTVDELRVWSYARSSSQIQKSMHQILSGEHAGLIAAYGFDDYGASDLDSTGHGNTATATDVFAAGSTPEIYAAHRVVQMTGPSQSLQVWAPDLDAVHTITYWVTRLPIHGRLQYSDGEGTHEVTSPSVVPSTLLYISSPGYAGDDQLELEASDGKAQSPRLVIDLRTPPAKRWIGAISSDWFDDDNWDPAGAPTTTDLVLIPGGTPPVVVDAFAWVAGLYVGVGGLLTVESDDFADRLFVNGHVVADGAIEGFGAVWMSATDSVVRGHLRNLYVDGPVLLGGRTEVAGNVIIASGSLTVAGSSLAVGGTLHAGGAGLIMTSAADFVDVQGDITWTGYAELTAGLLRAHAGFSLDTPGSYTFIASESGTHRLEMVGAVAHLKMDNCGAAGNRLRHLTVTSAQLVLEPGESYFTPALSFYATGDVIIGSATQSTTVDGTACQETPGAPLCSFGVGDSLAIGAGSTVSAGTVVVEGSLSIGSMGSLSVASVSYGAIGTLTGNVTATTLTLSTATQSQDPFAVGSHVSFTNLIVQRDITLSSAISVPGDLTLHEGTLEVGTQTVAVGGDMLVRSSSVLDMSESAGIVKVAGGFEYASYTMSTLSAGVIRIGGAVLLGPYGQFQPSGTHQVKLVASDTATVRVESDYSGNHFRHLTVTAPHLSVTSALTVTQRLPVSGTLALGLSGHPVELDSSGAALILDGSVMIGPGSTWTSDSDIAIGGRLLVAANGDLDTGASTLTADSLDIAASGRVDVATLHLKRTGGAFDDDTFVFTPNVSRLSFDDLVIERNVELAGPLDLPGSLTLASSYKLTMGGQTVAVGNDLIVSGISFALFMTDTDDLLDVSDDVVWTGGSASDLRAGVIVVHGQFDVAGTYGAFAPTLEHHVAMVGSGSSVAMDNAARNVNRFRHLDILGPGVFVRPSTSVTSSGDFAYVTGNLTVGDVAASAAFDSTGHTFQVEGDVAVESGSSWVSDDAIAVGGTVDVQPGGALATPTFILRQPVYAPDPVVFVSDGVDFEDLVVQRPTLLGGTLDVPGTLSVTTVSGLGVGGLLTLNGHTATVGGDFIVDTISDFGMTSSLDVLDVGGDVHWNIESGQWAGQLDLTAGLMRVHGDFTVPVDDTFNASGTHTVELAGSVSAVSMSSASQSGNRFRNLLVTSAAAAMTASDVYLTGTLTIQGASSTERAQLTIGTSRTVTVDGAIFLEDYGDLVVSGTLTGNSCTAESTATVTGFTCE